jgi:hypothetical protein
LTQSLRREFPVGVGDRSVAFPSFGMTPQYQVHIVLRMSEIGRLPHERDKGMTERRAGYITGYIA